MENTVETCVEALCEQGCQKVWQHIADLEEGKELPELEGLNPDQRLAVLFELKSIMAVYSDRCSVG